MTKLGIVGIVLALTSPAQKPAITPDGRINPPVLHRRVDLTSCAWVTFKNPKDFNVQVTPYSGSEVNVLQPGIADCAELPK